MDLLDGMNRAIAYIEANLENEISYSEMARLACCSQYHFSRMFVSISEVPLSEYIRRRRLTLAAFTLQDTDEKIINIALRYGYNSADAFTRAFQNLHGVTPSKARKKGVILRAYPRMTFTLSIKGVVAMNYRIEEKEGFRVVGIMERMCIKNEEMLKKIPEFWAKLSKETCAEILAQASGNPAGLLGISANMDGDNFDYWIATASVKDCPGNMKEMKIPATTWAIFDAVGPMPTAMQQVYRHIYSEWLPTSGYEHARTPDIEWYTDGDTSAADYKSAVWLPVVKK